MACALDRSIPDIFGSTTFWKGTFAAHEWRNQEFRSKLWVGANQGGQTCVIAPPSTSKFVQMFEPQSETLVTVAKIQALCVSAVSEVFIDRDCRRRRLWINFLLCNWLRRRSNSCRLNCWRILRNTLGRRAIRLSVQVSRSSNNSSFRFFLWAVFRCPCHHKLLPSLCPGPWNRSPWGHREQHGVAVLDERIPDTTIRGCRTKIELHLRSQRGCQRFHQNAVSKDLFRGS